MSTCQLLCDASHNRDLRLGGYSGGFQLKGRDGDWSAMYNGVVPESLDSNMAEMYAIAAGLKVIEERISAQGDNLTKLNIFTDSDASILQYSLFENGRQHNSKYSLILNEMHERINRIVPNGGLKMSHVKGHVPKQKATPLETFHNMIDANALSVRWKIQNNIFKPDTKKGRFYGIVLPTKAPVSKSHELKQLGYYYAKMGYIARVAFVGKKKGLETDHPFCQGVNLACLEDNRPKDSMLNIEKIDNMGGLDGGAEGLDRTLVYHHSNQVGRNKKECNFNKGYFQNGALASRIIHGPQSNEMLNTTYLNGRTQHASSFIVNVFENDITGMREEFLPSKVNEWIDVFSKYVDVPVIKGIDNALQIENIPHQMRLVDPIHKIKSELKDVAERYCNVLEPEQIFIKVLSTLGSNNIELDKKSRESIKKGIDAFDKNPERLVNTVLNTTFTRMEKEKPAEEINENKGFENRRSFRP